MICVCLHLCDRSCGPVVKATALRVAGLGLNLLSFWFLFVCLFVFFRLSHISDLSTKTERGCLYSWIKKTVTFAKISPTMVNPRDIAKNAEEEEDISVT